MALVVADRVFESTTTTGTGALTLVGATTGYRTFASVCSTNDTLYYAIQAVDGNGNPSGDWEVGIGTYSGTNTLTRTTPQASSNGGSAVNLSAGTKHVFLSSTKNYMAHLTALAGLSFVQGDIIYHNGTQLTRLAPGASGQYLKTQGASANPVWGTVSTGLFAPPLAADFTLFTGDAGAAVLTDDGDVGLVVTATTAVNTAILRGGYKALPAVGTDFSVAARVVLNCQYGIQHTWGGLTMYESATGKSHSFFIPSDVPSSPLHLRRQTLAASFSSEVTVGFNNPAAWFKMERVGTTLNFYTSQDGKNWHVVQSISQTTYLTTAPDRIGPSMLLSHATLKPIVSFPYWLQTGF